MSHPTRDIQLGKAIGRVPSGVYILSASHQGQSSAAMVSWVQQAAFEPLSLTVALAKGRPVADMVRASGMLALSVLGEHDMHHMKRFARGIEPGENPFAGLATGATAGGQIYLAEALAFLECRVMRWVDFDADHDLVIGQVLSGRILKEGASFTHTRGNGYHY